MTSDWPTIHSHIDRFKIMYVYGGCGRDQADFTHLVDGWHGEVSQQ